jgi:hypothetical protein
MLISVFFGLYCHSLDNPMFHIGRSVNVRFRLVQSAQIRCLSDGSMNLIGWSRITAMHRAVTYQVLNSPAPRLSVKVSCLHELKPT